MRESSGSTNIEKTLLKALKVLKLVNIPHYVCGGFAVQERGYPRFTVDVDIIVSDVALAIEKLSMNGFKKNPGSSMTVTDRETKVEVDVRPGGKKIDAGPLELPMPAHVSDKPRILTLETLINAKLSTYIGRGIERSQDHADVVKLVQVNNAPRDFRGRREGSRRVSQDLGCSSSQEGVTRAKKGPTYRRLRGGWAWVSTPAKEKVPAGGVLVKHSSGPRSFQRRGVKWKSQLFDTSTRFQVTYG